MDHLLAVLVVVLLVVQVLILLILKLVLLVVEEHHKVLEDLAVVLEGIVVVLCRAELVVMVRQMVIQTLEAAEAAVVDTMAVAVAVAAMIMEIPPAMLLVAEVDQDMFILLSLMDLLVGFPMVKIIQIEKMLERQDKMQR